VTQVAFDKWSCSSDGNYVFASAADDTKLAFWEFSVSNNNVNEVDPVNIENNSNHGGDNATLRPIVITTKMANEVNYLDPQWMSSASHGEPLSDILFLTDTLITSCYSQVSIWDRVQRLSNPLVD
jgi:hypothetical protein